MEIALIILRQILTMALYMLAGFALFKTGKITIEGSKTIAAILLWLVIPSTIINSFRTDFTPEKFRIFGISLLAGIGAILLSMMISRLIFRKNPVDTFGASFSNAGFIGIPLVQESLGNEAVFMLVGMIVGLNIAQWTYGARLLKGEKVKTEKVKTDIKQLLINPITISAAIGLILFVSGMGSKLPKVAGGFISGIASLNAPLAMLILGVYLAQTSLKSLVTTPALYRLSAVRLLLIPVITMLVLWPIPIDATIKLTIIIGASAPAGANVAVYSQVYQQDYTYACKIVAQSTLLSIITMPLILWGRGLVVS
ncbi:MAG: AEC family transporter [Lachnospiraceae bacterium]|nr:AEC family transporter [Lachnospiraceae bacterium]